MSAKIVAVLAASLLAYGSVTIVSPFGSQAGLYLADRNLGLALLLVVLLAIGWTRPLGALLMATAAMHLVDGVGDLVMGNLPAGVGSIVVAVISGAAAWWLIRSGTNAQRKGP